MEFIQSNTYSALSLLLPFGYHYHTYWTGCSCSSPFLLFHELKLQLQHCCLQHWYSYYLCRIDTLQVGWPVHCRWYWRFHSQEHRCQWDWLSQWCLLGGNLKWIQINWQYYSFSSKYKVPKSVVSQAAESVTYSQWPESF